ncbi:MAG: glycosyltransferase [Candidatus Omnitrophica bacterium]|nr:glycosyltransferase [Candidatus Omnitrophota bacterium]MCM8802491.1 glycosyltransferase [Candidatus Omnitrophota bacterium]
MIKKNGITGQDRIESHLSEKIKICYIIGTLEVGGAEKQLYLLIKNLDKERFKPFLIALRDGRMRKDFEEITNLYLLKKRFKFDLAILLGLIRIIKKEKPDILHTFMFTSNTWGRLAGIICKIPVIIASERSADLWKKWYHNLIDRFLLKFTKKIICNSEEVKNIYIKRIDGKNRKFEVIYNGIEIEKYEKIKESVKLKEEFGIKNEKIILTGGRLSFEKNLKRFLFVAKKIKGDFENVKFLIVGEGEEKERLKKLAENLNIKDSVIFTGYRNDLPELIKISDTVVLISLWEGMPNLIIEGMTCKKPVICTKIGGGKEIIKDGENGFLVDPDDEEEIKEKILFLLKNDEKCKIMGEKGYNFAKKTFSLKNMVENYQNLYIKLLGKGINVKIYT